jgi:Fic family protein
MTPCICVNVDACRNALRNEFLEQPGLRLTLPQAQRLWGLERLTCERALYDLVSEGFLVRAMDGQFCRPDYSTPND